MATEKHGGNWTQWSEYVLHELERLNDLCENLRTRISKLEKMVVWVGGGFAALTSLISIIYALFKLTR